MLRSLSKEPDCNSLCHYTRFLNYLTKKDKKTSLIDRNEGPPKKNITLERRGGAEVGDGSWRSVNCDDDTFDA